MKLKKKDLLEIIDSNGELIGKNDIPSVDANADSQAKNTTDYNAKIGQQPFRYDMLGRFGFTLMPFMEGKENQAQLEMLQELASLMHQRFAETLEYYYRNPNKLKSDFRKSQEEGHGHKNPYCTVHLLVICKAVWNIRILKMSSSSAGNFISSGVSKSGYDFRVSSLRKEVI